ncbi:hypothetical protein [Streptomyces chumphonensis]|uniref:hypothetical protein n=1 Tax=Streptomyces chumphonensis TaxID=1214925 RepID=UPI003D75D38B
MTTIVSAPPVRVAGPEEPEPQHDRVPDTPAPPPLPQRVPGRHLDHRTPAERKLADLLARQRDEIDRRAAATGRTAPRTRAQMEARRAAAGGGVR